MFHSGSYGGGCWVSLSSFAIFFFLFFFWLFHLFLVRSIFCSISFIDAGKNPDEFARDVLNSWIAKNQSTKGRTDAFKVVFKSPCGRLLKSTCLLFVFWFPKVHENLYWMLYYLLYSGFTEASFGGTWTDIPDEVESYREIRASSAVVSWNFFLLSILSLPSNFTQNDWIYILLASIFYPTNPSFFL